MARYNISLEKARTKEGNLVVPLDEIRTIDKSKAILTSGATNITIYDAGNKEAYIRQIWITETAGVAGSFQIADETGEPITPPIKLAGGQFKIIDTMLGPASKFAVASGCPINAEVTVVVQVDPKIKE